MPASYDLAAVAAPKFGLVSRHQYNAPVGAKEHDADVLILSSAIGSGHMRASAAVVRGVALLDPERTCSIVDFPHEVSPGIERLLRDAYLESLRLWPTAYGKLYQSSGTSQPSS